MARDLRRRLTAVLLVLAMAPGAGGAVVSGRVAMPEVCSPAVSPAVVRLEPLDTAGTAADVAEPPAFINQLGMRFEPRVVALRPGQALRFGNADPELHGVHIRGAGRDFNQAVAPGGSVEFVPERPGVYRVFCDVHPHMRAYVVAGGSPWATACGRSGAFRFRDVPGGRYRLRVWHEMGAPRERDVEVRGDRVDLGTVVVTEGPNAETADDRGQVCEKGCEPWPLVIDRIAVTLATSLESAQRPDGAGRAVPLAQDAFFRDFEASGLGTAVRVHLGRDRAARVAEQFRAIALSTRGLAAGDAGPSDVIAPTRRALLDLARASEELNRKGVTERSRIFSGTSPAFWVAEIAPAAAASAAVWPSGAAREWAVAALVVLSVVAAAAARSGPARGRRWFAAGAVVGLLAAAMAWVNRGSAGPGTPNAPPRVGPAAAPRPAAADPSARAEAPVRAYPIGLGVERNRLEIVPVWHRAVGRAGGPAPEPGAVHLAARIHATEGNPNGFARGEWVPYLTVRYSIAPAHGGPALRGPLSPLVAGDGPRYGADVRLPGPGDYRLTLQIEPPPATALGRVDDPSEGVAPWWEPFDVTFDWSFRPE